MWDGLRPTSPLMAQAVAAYTDQYPGCHRADRVCVNVDPCATDSVAHQYPPYPQPADPNGQLTTTPHPHSRNMPHPQACADYIAEQARKLKAKLRGYDDGSEN